MKRKKRKEEEKDRRVINREFGCTKWIIRIIGWERRVSKERMMYARAY